MRIAIFFMLAFPLVGSTHNLIGRHMRNIADTSGPNEISASLSSDEIDLENIEGIEEITKLVLIKTDSLPNDLHEKIDGRYLNGLMETLYTGLRKPFKSVSADILGIFPSFEEIRVRCNKSVLSGEQLERDESNRVKRMANKDIIDVDILDRRNDSSIGDANENGEVIQNDYKSSLNVCESVTKDCLSMRDLVQILPATIQSFDKALVRLCPIMLFRIMNNICHKEESDFLNARQRGDIETKRGDDELDGTNKNDSIRRDLLRETQKLKNRQNSDELSSKKPQKLHKKLRTQTNYNTKGAYTRVKYQHHDSVLSQQLLKIRLKLTEPSIEKVWIFSLLFVILSIVVSMGGLIVLPFVRRTTRRKILTLFEGLAVGGLAGSATLHMFPQAFGLVDENYSKYFWRIFMVFLGIYLCYLCERIMKILKVMRAKLKRSRASLIQIDCPYEFACDGGEMARGTSNRSSRSFKSRSLSKKSKNNSNHEAGLNDCTSPEDNRKQGRFKNSFGTTDILDTKSLDIEQTSIKRQRLIKCLKSVQQQFSPVYAVYNPALDEPVRERELLRANRAGSKCFDSRDIRKRGHPTSSLKLNRLDKAQFNSRSSMNKKSLRRHKQVETKLFHQNRMRPTLGDRSKLALNYPASYLSPVNNVAAERQDQDNAARMSADTVAWMIVFGDAVLNVIDGLSIGAAFERNLLAGISISVAVMLEEVTHRLGTFAVLIRAGMSMQQSLLCTFLSACALFPGLIVGILLSDATEDATPYIFCAAGGIFLYMALVDVMKEMNRSIENAMRKDIKSTLQIFALQNLGIVLAVIFLSFLALYEQAMDFEEYQNQYKQPSS